MVWILLKIKSEPEAVEIEEPVKVDTKEIEELISQTKSIEGMKRRVRVLPNTDEIESLLKILNQQMFLKTKEIEDLESI